MCSMLHMTPDIVVSYRLTSVCVCVFAPPIYMFFHFLFRPLLLWFFSALAVKFSSTAAKATQQQLHLHPAHCSLPAAAAQSAAAAAACATFEVLQVVKTFHVRKFCAHDLTS